MNRDSFRNRFAQGYSNPRTLELLALFALFDTAGPANGLISEVDLRSCWTAWAWTSPHLHSYNYRHGAVDDPIPPVPPPAPPRPRQPLTCPHHGLRSGPGA
jgi:hypothetical protein